LSIAAGVGMAALGIGYAITRGFPQSVISGQADVVAGSTFLLTLGVLLTRWGFELCFTVSGAFKENNIQWGAFYSLSGLALTALSVFGFIDLFTR
jgi:hypothetical protein